MSDDKHAALRAVLADTSLDVLSEELVRLGWVLRPLRSHGPLPEGVKVEAITTASIGGPVRWVPSFFDCLPPCYPPMAGDDQP